MPPEMNFRELERLRLDLEEISGRETLALSEYHDSKTQGFYHRHDKQTAGHFSKASTATCVFTLVTTGKWREGPWKAGAKELATALLSVKWKSAGLLEDNPFTVAFILEAVSCLQEVDSDAGVDLPQKIERAQGLLKDALNQDEDPGAVSLPEQNYPPSAYLTQLVVRVLQKEGCFREVAGMQNYWLKHLSSQLSLVLTDSKFADVYAVAYSLILIASLKPLSQLAQEQKHLFNAALRAVFERQLPDGSWPLSQPLFHYPKVGNAHCYEYEMLTQLLQHNELHEHLLQYLPRLGKCVSALRETAFELENGGYAWASGHHPNLEGPESWSTASVYSFIHELKLLVAEGIRKHLFHYVDVAYNPPKSVVSSSEFAPNLLDSKITLDGRSQSLKKLLKTSFLEPLSSEASAVLKGKSFGRRTPISFILFGPPGTAKTELAKTIAEYLGWPFLPLDPSHLVRHGMEQLHAEASKLFHMLAASEAIVVLLDEFDEMVRERESGSTDVFSRLLTTTMLPKLATINKRRRIIFIIATNYIDKFDFAISRPGRFDAILQIMPPSVKEKLKSQADFQQHLRKLKVNVSEIKDGIKPLTFLEFEDLVYEALKLEKKDQVVELVRQKKTTCILEKRISDDDETRETWADRCKKQQMHIRV